MAPAGCNGKQLGWNKSMCGENRSIYQWSIYLIVKSMNLWTYLIVKSINDLSIYEIVNRYLMNSDIFMHVSYTHSDISSKYLSIDIKGYITIDEDEDALSSLVTHIHPGWLQDTPVGWWLVWGWMTIIHTLGIIKVHNWESRSQPTSRIGIMIIMEWQRVFTLLIWHV